ncbi:MAG TPA: iron-containing alcohol dehydrogenase [Bacteroidales bacterium]|nr:iron-containing alcohol dehydrogenase [Bacteroidales bacterium]
MNRQNEESGNYSGNIVPDGLSKLQLSLRKFVAPEYIFGMDARLMAGIYCKNLGGKKVFLVTDKGVKGAKWFAEIEQTLKNQNISYHIFSGVSPNPRDYEVTTGVTEYRESQCNMILAVGGGSVLDCAKGIGIVSTNRGDVYDFEGVDKIERPMPPLVCIPTTAGTSADVSQFAIINNTREKYKMAIISKAVVPDASLIDPYVLTTMDKFLTACTGMDALSHAFEAFVSNASSAFTDLFSMEAIRLIHENLMNSINDPGNIQFRGKVMLASLYAGLAFSNASLGCVHSMAHSLGGYLDLPHGECNAILLPHVVEFNFDTSALRYKKIAEIFDVNISGMTDNQAKKALKSFIVEHIRMLGITSTLRTKGVSTDLISVLSQKAIKDPCNATNPKSPTKGDLETIYSEAM